MFYFVFALLQAAVDAVLMGENVFFTGSAGTGKSFLLKHLVNVLAGEHRDGGVFVTASTGCAALAINGCTLHRCVPCALHRSCFVVVIGMADFSV